MAYNWPRMPKLREYRCACGVQFEHLFMTADETPACPECGVAASENDELMGGTLCSTIIPMYKGSLKQKAGYVHTHADRPAEKGSVAVPRKGNIA